MMRWCGPMSGAAPSAPAAICARGCSRSSTMPSSTACGRAAPKRRASSRRGSLPTASTQAPQEHSVRLAQMREAFFEPAGRAALGAASRRHRGPYLRAGSQGHRRAAGNADVTHRPGARGAARDGRQRAGACQKSSPDRERRAMTAVLDPVTDADLDAYVDDQLDVARRIEVEAFLSARPETAARVMSDLRTRDELRVALAGSKGMARPATADAARRLEQGTRTGPCARRAAAGGGGRRLRRRGLAGERHARTTGDQGRRLDPAAGLSRGGDPGAPDDADARNHVVPDRGAELRQPTRSAPPRRSSCRRCRRTGRSATCRSIRHSSARASRWSSKPGSLG